jgi:hypothetical protein
VKVNHGLPKIPAWSVWEIPPHLPEEFHDEAGKAQMLDWAKSEPYMAKSSLCRMSALADVVLTLGLAIRDILFAAQLEDDPDMDFSLGYLMSTQWNIPDVEPILQCCTAMSEKMKEVQEVRKS